MGQLPVADSKNYRWFARNCLWPFVLQNLPGTDIFVSAMVPSVPSCAQGTRSDDQTLLKVQKSFRCSELGSKEAPSAQANHVLLQKLEIGLLGVWSVDLWLELAGSYLRQKNFYHRSRVLNQSQYITSSPLNQSASSDSFCRPRSTLTSPNSTNSSSALKGDTDRLGFNRLVRYCNCSENSLPKQTGNHDRLFLSWVNILGCESQLFVGRCVFYG